jgi:hypothetical protein
MGLGSMIKLGGQPETMRVFAVALRVLQLTGSSMLDELEFSGHVGMISQPKNNAIVRKYCFSTAKVSASSVSIKSQTSPADNVC